MAQSASHLSSASFPKFAGYKKNERSKRERSNWNQIRAGAPALFFVVVFPDDGLFLLGVWHRKNVKFLFLLDDGSVPVPILLITVVSSALQVARIRSGRHRHCLPEHVQRSHLPWILIFGLPRLGVSTSCPCT